MSEAPFAELSPPYSTIVADPPWLYDRVSADGTRRRLHGGGTSGPPMRRDGYQGAWFGYSQMDLEAIRGLPVSTVAAQDARLFLWTTNRYLRHAWDVVEAWGFTPQDRVLVWCKPPRGTMNVTTEFVLLGKRGNPPRMPWHGSTWFDWPHPGPHSAKPDAFGDLVESWCPGPYVELFARAPRLGWDSWGYGYEIDKKESA